MSHKIIVITDSTSDLPEDLRAQYDIRIVPLFVIWGKEQLRDKVDITPEAFYQRLPNDPIHPKTSQPAPGDFLAAYETAKKDGAEEIVVITISSAISGTYQSAKQAADLTDVPVHVYDSKSASMGLGFQVLAAARARQNGADVKGMIAAADAARQNMQFFITLNTLEYLHKGGRINTASRFLGTMLSIKPQIYIDHQTGLIEAGQRARTRGKALEATYQDFFRNIDVRKTLHVAVLHNAAPAEAEEMAQRIRENYQPSELFITIVSPVLGVHTGPEAIAIAGYTE